LERGPIMHICAIHIPGRTLQPSDFSKAGSAPTSASPNALGNVMAPEHIDPHIQSGGPEGFSPVPTTLAGTAGVRKIQEHA
jgi:hypothetical protein